MTVDELLHERAPTGWCSHLRITRTRSRAGTLVDRMNDPDPRPLPPEKPLPGDCCDGGCDNCVLTVYTEELEEYEQALAAWRGRHPDAPRDG